MSTLSYLTQASLTTGDFNTRTSFLYEGFLAENLITLVYADGGNGKSWLGFALAKHCAKINKQVNYLDFDNPLSVLKDRRIDENLVQPYDNLNYVYRSKCQLQPDELLTKLGDEATKNAYKGCVFVIDSLRNFVNISNDSLAMQTFSHLMNMREAGATIIILHHSNKDGKNYQGSNNIRNSIDNMYQLSKTNDDTSTIKVHLKVTKERCAIADQAFTINTRTLAMAPADITASLMDDEENAFVDTVKNALKEKPSNKTELLTKAGRDKGNKRGRNWLDKYEGEFWQSSKEGGVTIYTLAP